MMTQQEAVAIVEAWLKAYSTFEVDRISVTSKSNGAWVVQVECGVVAWIQVVSPDGEVSPPVWLE